MFTGAKNWLEKSERLEVRRGTTDKNALADNGTNGEYTKRVTFCALSYDKKCCVTISVL